MDTIIVLNDSVMDNSEAVSVHQRQCSKVLQSAAILASLAIFMLYHDHS